MVLSELNITSEDQKIYLEVIETKQVNDGKDGFILIKKMDSEDQNIHSTEFVDFIEMCFKRKARAGSLGSFSGNDGN